MNFETNMAKYLISLGIVLVLIGIFWQLGAKYIQLGNLPGDIRIERDGFKFYFPLMSCVVVSMIISLVVSFFRWFK